MLLSGVANLPSLNPIDPDPSPLYRQVIHVDFDGAQNVTYDDGAARVEGINGPAFSAERAGLGGQEPQIVEHTIEALNEQFADERIRFTEIEPDSNIEHSTIYVGGDESVIAEHESLLSVSEEVDEGNRDHQNQVFVFSESVLPNDVSEDTATDLLVDVISNETNRLLAFDQNTLSPTETEIRSEIGTLDLISQRWQDIVESNFFPNFLGRALKDREFLEGVSLTFGQISEQIKSQIVALRNNISDNAIGQVTFGIALTGEGILGGGANTDKSKVNVGDSVGTEIEVSEFAAGYNVTWDAFGGKDGNWTLARALTASIHQHEVGFEFFATVEDLIVNDQDEVTFGIKFTGGIGPPEVKKQIEKSIGPFFLEGTLGGNFDAAASITLETTLKVSEFKSMVGQETFAEGLADVFIPYYGDSRWENVVGIAFPAFTPIGFLLNVSRPDTPLGLLVHSKELSASADVSATSTVGAWGQAGISPRKFKFGRVGIGAKIGIQATEGAKLTTNKISFRNPLFESKPERLPAPDLAGHTGDLLRVDLASVAAGRNYDITGFSVVNESNEEIVPLDFKVNRLRGDLLLTHAGDTDQEYGEIILSDRIIDSTLSFEEVGRFYLAPTVSSNLPGDVDQTEQGRGFQGLIRVEFDVDVGGATVNREAIIEILPGYSLGGVNQVDESQGVLNSARIQQRLNYLGFPDKAGETLAVDGIIGPLTRHAIGLFNGAVRSPHDHAPSSFIDIGWINSPDAPSWGKFNEGDFGENIDLSSIEENQRYGTSWLWTALHNASRDIGDLTVRVQAISSINGANSRNHRISFEPSLFSHEAGMDLAIEVFAGDGQSSPTIGAVAEFLKGLEIFGEGPLAGRRDPSSAGLRSIVVSSDAWAETINQIIGRDLATATTDPSHPLNTIFIGFSPSLQESLTRAPT